MAETCNLSGLKRALKVSYLGKRRRRMLLENSEERSYRASVVNVCLKKGSHQATSKTV